MATPVRVTIDLKDVWEADAVWVITDDGREHDVPMTGTMIQAARQCAWVALGLFGQPHPSAYRYGSR